MLKVLYPLCIVGLVFSSIYSKKFQIVIHGENKPQVN